MAPHDHLPRVDGKPRHAERHEHRVILGYFRIDTGARRACPLRTRSPQAAASSRAYRLLAVREPETPGGLPGRPRGAGTARHTRRRRCAATSVGAPRSARGTDDSSASSRPCMPRVSAADMSSGRRCGDDAPHQRQVERRDQMGLYRLMHAPPYRHAIAPANVSLPRRIVFDRLPGHRDGGIFPQLLCESMTGNAIHLLYILTSGNTA